MKKNVGSYDGAVRFVAGCGLLMLGNHGFGWWGLLGLIPIVSTVTGVCFVYALLGLDTTACDRVAHGSSQRRRPRAYARLLQ